MLLWRCRFVESENDPKGDPVAIWMVSPVKNILSHTLFTSVTSGSVEVDCPVGLQSVCCVHEVHLLAGSLVIATYILDYTSLGCDRMMAVSIELIW